MRSWINYKVFVSSTFRDMDFERDAIQFHVIPRLNEKYRPYKVQFQLVDLRVGINTANLSEEEKENHVLNVCFDSIEQSRPFFIALLGDRYGWVPDDMRWDTVFNRLGLEQQNLLVNSKGKSVTEMEILYGAIGNNGQYLSHSIFMVRSHDSYKGMPLERLKLYADEANSDLTPDSRLRNEEQLRALKEHIIDIAKAQGMQDNICPYDLEWDPKANKFVHLERFEDLLFARLCAAIDDEIEHVAQEEQTWYGQETNNLSLQTSYISEHSIRSSYYDCVIKALHTDGHQWLISGATGCGKSVVAAQCADYLQHQGYKCCIAMVGQTFYSRQMRPILCRWLKQLGLPNDPAEWESMSNKQLYTLLQTQVNNLKQRGEEVWFVVDGVEQFALYADDDVYQTWIWEGANVILTAHSDYAGKCLHYHPAMREIAIAEWSPIDRVKLLSYCARQGNIELPEPLKDKMLIGCLNPLRLKMLMGLICHLSMSDFEKIRMSEADDEMSKINNYLISLVDNAPQSFDDFINYVFQTLTKRMELGESYLALFQYISASVMGLRESDMRMLLGDKWDPLTFHSLAYVLGDIMKEDHYSRLWSIGTSIREVLLQKDQRDIYKDLVNFLLSLRNDDPLKRSILIYCIIQSETYGPGARFLGEYSEYEDDKDMQTWLETSITLLLADPKRLEHLTNLCALMPATKVVFFVDQIVRNGLNDVHDTQKTEEAKSWQRALLYGLDPNAIDVASGAAYTYAYQMMQIQGKEMDMPKRRQCLSNAILCFQRCLDYDPHNNNAKQMYAVALMELAQVAMSEGNMQEAERLMNQMTEIF